MVAFPCSSARSCNARFAPTLVVACRFGGVLARWHGTAAQRRCSGGSAVADVSALLSVCCLCAGNGCGVTLLFVFWHSAAASVACSFALRLPLADGRYRVT